MQITNIRTITPANGSKTVAFVDIDFGGVLMRSFRLADFDGKFQIQPPSRPASQKEKDKGFKKDYVFTCQFTSYETRQKLLDEAVKAYKNLDNSNLDEAVEAYKNLDNSNPDAD